MQEKIIVAHIIGKWLGGGVESVVMNYYRNIDRNKIQFDFICDEDSTDIPYDEIKKLGGRVIIVPPYQKLGKYLKELRKVFKQNNYKIVHSHINTLSVFPLYAAKKENIPVRIAHSHSTTNKKEGKKNLIKQILRPFSKKFATHYFCCSEKAGRWLFGDKEYDKGNVYLLNNAIDLEKFSFNEKTREKVRKELKIDNDIKVIGHVGRFVSTKNQEFIIDIFDLLHKNNLNTRLLLVGQGPDMDKIKEKVKKLSLDSSVMFLGQRNDINELYQAMDIFILPSLYEGLGIALIEAQESGLPCIASTDVSMDAEVTKELSFISLKSSITFWVNQIQIKLKNSIRKSYTDEIEKQGYNIKLEAKKLEEKYFNM